LPETKPFLNETVAYEAGRHEALQNARILEALAPGLEARLGRSRYTIGDEDRQWAAGRVAHGAAWSDSTGPLVAIHPGAGAAVKQLPPGHWAAVATALYQSANARLILTGGPAEKPLTHAVAGRTVAPTLDLAGETTLGQLAAIYQACDLVLGSDSGPLHLAVAAGAKTVHLYGPVPAAKFGPWGDPARNVVVQSPFVCAPCDRLDWPAHALPLHGCLAAITPEEVIAAAARLLETEKS
jgi:heptosyltransferase-2/heptosyltransferase-3